MPEGPAQDASPRPDRSAPPPGPPAPNSWEAGEHRPGAGRGGHGSPAPPLGVGGREEGPGTRSPLPQPLCPRAPILSALRPLRAHPPRKGRLPPRRPGQQRESSVRSRTPPTPASPPLRTALAAPESPAAGPSGPAPPPPAPHAASPCACACARRAPPRECARTLRGPAPPLLRPPPPSRDSAAAAAGAGSSSRPATPPPPPPAPPRPDQGLRAGAESAPGGEYATLPQRPPPLSFPSPLGQSRRHPRKNPRLGCASPPFHLPLDPEVPGPAGPADAARRPEPRTILSQMRARRPPPGFQMCTAFCAHPFGDPEGWDPRRPRAALLPAAGPGAPALRGPPGFQLRPGSPPPLRGARRRPRPRVLCARVSKSDGLGFFSIFSCSWGQGPPSPRPSPGQGFEPGEGQVSRALARGRPLPPAGLGTDWSRAGEAAQPRERASSPCAPHSAVHS